MDTLVSGAAYRVSMNLLHTAQAWDLAVSNILTVNS